MKRILKQTDKELLVLRELNSFYQLEWERDKEGNEEVVIRIEGNARDEMLEKILCNVFGLKEPK